MVCANLAQVSDGETRDARLIAGCEQQIPFQNDRKKKKSVKGGFVRLVDVVHVANVRLTVVGLRLVNQAGISCGP